LEVEFAIKKKRGVVLPSLSRIIVSCHGIAEVVSRRLPTAVVRI
jgi:hypothetical protein